MFFEGDEFSPMVETEGFLRSASQENNLEVLLFRLEDTSSYHRHFGANGQDLLQSHEGENFTIKRITNPEDPALKHAHDLFWQEFGYGTDYFSLMQELAPDKNLAYHVILNDEEKVVAASNSGYLALGNVSESILAVWLMVVDKEHRGKKLVQELYQDIYRFGLERVSAEKTKLKAIVGEASCKQLEKIEYVLNRSEIGRKRVYYQDQNEIVHEVPYVSPPLKWNIHSGVPEEEAQPNRLMLRLLDSRQSMPAYELLEIIARIYEDSYAPVRTYFSDQTGFEQATGIFNGYFKRIEKELAEAKDGEVFLLSAEERKQRLGK
ncbi:hypothetical protein HYV87_02910 [Candidatus Woesearchaeota archaeon]|nr:hypothetical protein [Candidatus Woesearchaeota archaeon]